MFPAYGTSNPWRSRSQPPPPRRNRKPHPSKQADESRTQQPRPQAAQEPAEEPVDERTQRLRQLDGIKRRFAQKTSSFSPPPPASLTFQPSASSNAPKLDYTSTNAPVHGYEDALTKLLMELDGVESGGDLDVRTRRKELVKKVESEAQRVEKWRRDCFEARQKGEEGPEWSKAAIEGDEAKPDDGKAEELGDRGEKGGGHEAEEATTTDGDADEERGELEADEVSTVTTASMSRPSITPQTPSSVETGSVTEELARPPGLPLPSSQEKEHTHDALEAAATEDGDEDDAEGAFAAAVEEEDEEEEPRQVPLRGRLPSAPASHRPHVAATPRQEFPVHPQRQRQPDVHEHPEFRIHPQRLQQQQPHRHVEPERRYVDPLEALLGIPSRRLAEQPQHTDVLFRRRSPQPYVPATYADDDDDEMDYSPFHAYTPQTQRPVYRSPPQQRRQVPYGGYSTPSSLFGGGGVPWYAHGYPHERDLYEHAQRQQQQQAQHSRAPGYGAYGGGFGGGPFGFGGMW
ncbi:hypothetical protein JCM10296v2_001432 [Rhodotorula toruloides]